MPRTAAAGRRASARTARSGGAANNRRGSRALWPDATYDRRVVVTAVNDRGRAFNDHPLSIVLPPGVDTVSLMGYEATSRDTVETYGHRYNSGSTSYNNLPDLVLGSGNGQAYAKLTGLWPADETRFGHLYWKDGGGGAARSYRHLGPVPRQWTLTVVRGATGDVYAATVGGTTYSYVQLAGDTTASLVGTGLAAVITAGTKAAASNSNGVLTITQNDPTDSTFTVARAGTTTVPANLTPGILLGWTVTVVNAVNGAAYVLVIDGQTYTVTAGGADTVTTIAAALAAAINAGAVAYATSASGVVSIARAVLSDYAFSVANTGTTTPTDLTVVKPSFFLVGRIGPDVSGWTPISFAMGLPYGVASGIGNSRVMLGRKTTQGVRMLNSKVNADAGSYGAASSTITSLAVNGPYVEAAGILTWENRSGLPDWDATWSVRYHQKFVRGRKADGTVPLTIDKECGIFEATLVYRAARAHTPPTITTAVTSSSQFELLLFGSTDNTFSGNATTEAAYQAYTDFHASLFADGALVARPGDYANLAAEQVALSALAPTDVIVGSSGNGNASALRVRSVTFDGWGATQTPAAKWTANSSHNAVLQIVGTTNTATIPQDATVTVRYVYANSVMLGVTTLGLNMLADEIVSVVRGVEDQPTVTLGPIESYDSQAVERTHALALTDAVRGVGYFLDNAAAFTGFANAICWRRHVRGITGLTNTATMTVPDDDDGTYGMMHALSGLCLLYRLTGDATLVARIERIVQYVVDIEEAAYQRSPTWARGFVPYWVAPVALSGAVYDQEGVLGEWTPGRDDLVDPAWVAINGGVYAKGPHDYVAGELRYRSSIDQATMVAHGLYHYLWVCRNTALASNTTLWNKAIALVGYMRDFQSAKYGVESQLVGNLYARVTGGTPTNPNGITATRINAMVGASASNTLTHPYYGTDWGAWQVDGTSTEPNGIDASANTVISHWMRGVVAPNTTEDAMLTFMLGGAADCLVPDVGLHDLRIRTALGTGGLLRKRLPGDQLRIGLSNNNAVIESPRTSSSVNGYATETKIIELGGLGSDHGSGRGYQRGIVVGLLALMDPTALIPVEYESGAVTRTVAAATALDNTLNTLECLTVDAGTGAVRYASPRDFGTTSTFNSGDVDSAFTGYRMWLVALREAVRRRVAGTLTADDVRDIYGFAS